jgi:hypothetical protein
LSDYWSVTQKGSRRSGGPVDGLVPRRRG